MYDDAAKERQKEAASKAGKASGASRRGETNVPDNCTERSGQDARDQVGQAFGVSGGTVDRARVVTTDEAARGAGVEAAEGNLRGVAPGDEARKRAGRSRQGQ